MKASRFSDAKSRLFSSSALTAMPVVDICRKAGISQTTYFNWKI